MIHLIQGKNHKIMRQTVKSALYDVVHSAVVKYGEKFVQYSRWTVMYNAKWEPLRAILSVAVHTAVNRAVLFRPPHQNLAQFIAENSTSSERLFINFLHRRGGK